MYADTVLELRRARRKRRLQKINVAELLYRGYLTVIGVGAGVWVLSSLPKDHRLTAHQIATANAPEDLRAYLCTWCDSWHLTKGSAKSARERRRPNKSRR